MGWLLNHYHYSEVISRRAFKSQLGTEMTYFKIFKITPTFSFKDGTAHLSRIEALLLGNSTVSVRPTPNFLMFTYLLVHRKNAVQLHLLKALQCTWNFFWRWTGTYSQTRRKYGVGRTLIVELPIGFSVSSFISDRLKKADKAKTTSLENLSIQWRNRSPFISMTKRFLFNQQQCLKIEHDRIKPWFIKNI